MEIILIILEFNNKFTDETHGIRNLTLVTYPVNSLLANATQINTTKRWNLIINHTDSP